MGFFEFVLLPFVIFAVLCVLWTVMLFRISGRVGELTARLDEQDRQLGQLREEMAARR